MASNTPERDPSTPLSIASAEFSKKRKGIDPDEVRSFLVAVGAEVERLSMRIAELEADLAAAQTPMLDLTDLSDEAAVAAVGDEAARVLRTAREEAGLLRERAEEAAARQLADASLTAERLVREATEAARRERAEVKSRLREMIDEAERHVERVRMRAERNRESARLWAAEAEHAQRLVVEEFERARTAAADVIAALAPQSLVDEIDDVVADVVDVPVVDDVIEPATPIAEVVPADVDAAEPESESESGDGDGDGGGGARVVHLFGVPRDDVTPPADDIAEPSARDVALVQIVPRLIRRAKRTFTEEQKAIIAQLDGRAVTDVADVLAGPDEHAGAHVDPLRRDLEAAAVAGAQVFGGQTDAGSVVLDEAIAVITAGVAGEIRRRLEVIINEASGDNAAIDSAVRSMYRDLRRDVVDERITDAALHAYSAGVIASVPAEMTLRWVPAPGVAPCAECEDNVLAGLVTAGSPFPTGHLAPPAHPGCRCDLAAERR